MLLGKIKSRHVAGMGKITKLYFENQKERDHLGELGL
jgi:hypothetical protein